LASCSMSLVDPRPMASAIESTRRRRIVGNSKRRLKHSAETVYGLAANGRISD